MTIDLQAAQSPHYRDRGIARYSCDFTEALAASRPDLVHQVLLNPRLPAIERLDRLVGTVPVLTEPQWQSGGIFHLISPYELDTPIGELWPRAASRHGVRLVVTVYDLIPEVLPHIYLQAPGLRRRYRARHQLVRAADHVLTISDSASADVVRYLGIPEDRVTSIGAGVTPGFTPPADRAAAAADTRKAVPGLTDPYVVYNGAIEPRKNVEALVEAFAQAPPDVRSRWQLVIVCSLKPNQRNHLEVLARRLGIEGRLVLAGYVPDATLRLLYQGCDLMMFPSLYEGYGLPIAEALACGAAVIASGTSSMQELVAPSATFDPSSIDSMAGALSRALTDQALRAELHAWAHRPIQTWSDVAAKAAAVYEKVLAMPGAARHRWRSTPRVAMVTPWPPQRTGVADYSRRLVEAMRPDFDVDVLVDGDLPAGEALPEPAVGRAKDFQSRDAANGGYDAVVLSLGNSEFHAGALKLMRENPGRFDVLAHDVRLADLYAHGLSRGAVPEGFEAAARDAYPTAPGSVSFDGDVLEAAGSAGLYMIRDVISRARSVLTTSDFAAAVARADAAEGTSDRVGVWSWAYPPAVERDPRRREDGLLCTFGVIHHSKEPAVLVRALDMLRRRHAAVRLAFVGPVSDELRAEMVALASDLGIGDLVVLTGYVSDKEYEQWLQRAAVAVQLRRRSNGETSAAIADCLAHGIPTIVSDLGPQGELPNFVAKVPPGSGPDAVAAQIEFLLDEGSTREASQRSLEFVRANGFERAAARLWQLVPELREWPREAV